MKGDHSNHTHMSGTPTKADAASDIRSISETEFQMYFETIYQEHVDNLMKFAFFRLSDRERSVDTVQDVFINYFAYLKRIREDDAPHALDFNHRAFLFRSLRNSIIDHYRSKKSYSLDVLLDEGFEVHSEEDATYQTETALTHKYVLEQIKHLKPKQQELLYMRYIEDMTVQDIALALGERENTISVQLHRVIESLKKRM